MNENLIEIMRLITNMIRTGIVSDVDKVNWLTLRAANTRTWWKPS